MKNGIGDLWLNPPTVNTKYGIKRYGVTFCRRLEEQYIQIYDSKCLSSETYNILSYLQESYSMAKYLSDVKNCNIRANITKLRVGDAKLSYYTGVRFNKPKLCEMCNINEEETAEHLVLQCAKYEQCRTKFIEKVNNLHIDFNSMLPADKMYFLNVDHRAINEICSFLSDIFKSRKLIHIR